MAKQPSSRTSKRFQANKASRSLRKTREAVSKSTTLSALTQSEAAGLSSSTQQPNDSGQKTSQKEQPTPVTSEVKPSSSPAAHEVQSSETTPSDQSSQDSHDDQNSQKSQEPEQTTHTQPRQQSQQPTHDHPHPIRRFRAAYARYQQTRLYQIWDRRIKFSYGAYVVIMFALIELADMFLLWSTATNQQYDPSATENIVQQVVKGTYHSLAGTAGILNFFALDMIYLVCVTLINRFWIGTALFGTIAGIFAFAGKVKITMRDEPIVPSDLGFLTGEAGGENVADFATADMQPTIHVGVKLVVLFVILCLILQLIDKRTTFIYASWRHPIAKPANFIGLICRILAPILSITLLVTYANGLSTVDSGTRKFVDEIGYTPKLWNAIEDAQTNGAATTFLSLANVKAMANEPDYNEAAMRTIADRYTKTAKSINEERNATLTDSTVIMVLSETFSDPNRVPNINFAVDPMPNIRALGNTTTSGIMLSPGYGGGTANIEFQQMTGLSMANFSDSMLSPYQQLVPTRSEMYSFNRMWNQACGGSTDCSVGFHPFKQGFYMRGVNYKKFGFSHLYTLDSNPQIKYTGKYTSELGTTTTVTDEEAYKSVLEEVRTNTNEKKPSQFIELVTMQNHAPYPDVYGSTNEFHAADRIVETTSVERGVIANYAKGIQRTDEATAAFLKELDTINTPITVVFYGDHLPGIYSSAAANKKNNIALHETNYFIWSNQASSSHDVKLPESNAAYSSSNYFMAQAAQQMDAKVSPYLALLDKLHEQVPAISKAVTDEGSWGSGSPTLLNDKGEMIDPNTLSKEAQQLLADYKMVQYDMTVGNNYLQKMGFMDLLK